MTTRRRLTALIAWLGLVAAACSGMSDAQRLRLQQGVSEGSQSFQRSMQRGRINTEPLRPADYGRPSCVSTPAGGAVYTNCY